MKIICDIILGVIYLTLSVIYIASMMRKEEEEEEPVIQYSNDLHELITSLYEIDGQIQMVKDMKINIDTSDSPIQGDAVRSMDIYWDWCGKLEQQTAIPIVKGTPTAEAMRHLADVREEELLRKLTVQIMALPRSEISDKK